MKVGMSFAVLKNELKQAVYFSKAIIKDSEDFLIVGSASMSEVHLFHQIPPGFVPDLIPF